MVDYAGIFKKSQLAEFTNQTPCFCAICTKSRKRCARAVLDHICQISYCRPPAAAKAGIRRSVPHMEIFLLKADLPIGPHFSRNCSRLPGRAAYALLLFGKRPHILIGFWYSICPPSRQKLIEANTNSAAKNRGEFDFF